MFPTPSDRARVAHEIGATVRLALPLITAQLAAVGTNVVDAMLAGHYSAHVLGAIAVGASIWALAIVSGIGMMMAVPPSVSQLDGAGRRAEVGPVFRQALGIVGVELPEFGELRAERHFGVARAPDLLAIPLLRRAGAWRC